MGEETMRRSIFLIADALTRFARSNGWNDFDYWIYYRANPDWDRVHFVFVARGFDDQDEYECTRGVWEYLEQELRHEPAVLRSLSLVVRSKKQVDEGGLYAIGSEYREFHTFDRVKTS